MSSYIDKDINPHSFEEKDSKNTQEGTLISPPVTIYTISINGMRDNYVTHSDHNRIVAEKDAEISRLKKELEEIHRNMVSKDEFHGLFEKIINQSTSPKEPTDKPDNCSYHDVHFDNKVDVPTLTQELILFSEKFSRAC